MEEMRKKVKEILFLLNGYSVSTAVDRLNKVPTYDELLKENKRQREVINNFLDIVDKSKMLLNNPDLLDLYLKIKKVE